MITQVKLIFINIIQKLNRKQSMNKLDLYTNAITLPPLYFTFPD